ncbi:MAG: ATP-binding protein [bacterium]
MIHEEQLFRMRFPASAYELMNIRSIVLHTMNDLGCSVDDIHQSIIAVNEACSNVIRHAYKDDPGGEIIVEIAKQNHELLFRITDFADYVDPSKIKSRDISQLKPGGLGVYIIYQIMDDVRYKHRSDGIGNILEMRKHVHYTEKIKETV